MRSQLLLLGLMVGGAAVLSSMIACSSSETHVIEIPAEGGLSTVDGSDTGDGGEPSYDLPSTALIQGEYGILAVIGTQAIIRDYPASGNVTISSIPVTGGTPTTIFQINPATDGLAATKAALAHWSNVVNGVGQLDVWTVATGLKTGVTPKSVSGAFFAASEDGTRIAFTQDATVSGTTVQSASLAVRDLASTTNLVTLNAAGQPMNLLAAAKGCAPQLEFELAPSTQFYAMYCTGTDATSTTGRIYSIPGTAAPTAIRLDDTTGDANPNTVDATHGFSTSVAGDKIAWVDTTKKLKAITTATPATVDILDTGAQNVFMLGDGSAVVYAVPVLLGDGGVASLTLKKATIAPTPVITTVATVPGLGYVDNSDDQMKIVFAEQEDTSQGTTDLHFIDFSAATPTIVDLLTEPNGSEVGFTGDDKTVVWADINTPMMRSFTVGGQPKDLVAGNGGLLPETGSDLIVFSDPLTNGSDTSTVYFSVGLTDAVAGGTLKTIAIGNPSPQAFISGKTLVYAKAIDSDNGIFTLSLP